jgi:GT2 family glycosyltransferase
MCRCVWGSPDGHSAILFDNDEKWTTAASAASEELARADLIVRCDVEIATHHRPLVACKPMLTLAPVGGTGFHFRLNVSDHVASRPPARPGSAEVTSSPTLVPLPLPWWEETYAGSFKDSMVRVCFAGSERTPRPPGAPDRASRICAMLERLRASYPIEVHLMNSRDGAEAGPTDGRGAHIMIDDCSPGGGGEYSLAGLAWSCVVINGLDSCPSRRATFQSLTASRNELPFLCASLETLESLLACLIQSGSKSLEAAGRRNRRWMESEWNFSRQWSEFWYPVIARAMASTFSAPAANPRRLTTPSPKPHASFSVVIVTRDESTYLRRTVHSLCTNPSAPDEIIVVDDQSTDGSTEGLVETYGRVRVLRPDRRLGVAGARNYGAERARGDVIVFSDAHIEVPQDWAVPILDALSIDHAGAAATGLENLRQRPGKGVCGGRWRPGTADYLRWEWLRCKTGDPYPIPLLTGGFLAMRREVFEKVGGFDSGMFKYGVEDTELSVRLWTMGYQCLAVPRVLVAHRFDSPTGKAGCDYKNAEIAIHNKLRLAVLHFSAQRIERVVKHFAGNPKFPAAFGRLAQGDAWTRRQKLHAVRKHDDDWYFQRFAIPL